MKEKKYKAICKQRNITFIPFIVYSTGKIHKDGMAFLRSLAKHAQDVRQISQDTLVKYYVKCLNFALIKQVSYSIYAKTVESMTVGGHVNVRTNKVIRVGNLSANEIAHPPLVVNPVYRNT